MSASVLTYPALTYPASGLPVFPSEMDISALTGDTVSPQPFQSPQPFFITADRFAPADPELSGPVSGKRALAKQSVQIRIPKNLPLLTDLEPGQEVPEELRETLNPMQRMGVWLIENGYQRLALKQTVFKQLRDSGFDVCAYSRRAREAGHGNWQSCSQYTKMAIVHDGFFKGCFKGFVRIASCNPLLFNKHRWAWSERLIERLAMATPEKEKAESA